jgi:TPR repeat protein
MYAWGMYADGQGMEKDLVEAVRLYKLAAIGKWVEQNYVEAVRWYRAAAAQAYADHRTIWV